MKKIHTFFKATSKESLDREMISLDSYIKHLGLREMGFTSVDDNLECATHSIDDTDYYTFTGIVTLDYGYLLDFQEYICNNEIFDQFIQDVYHQAKIGNDGTGHLDLKEEIINLSDEKIGHAIGWVLFFFIYQQKHYVKPEKTEFSVKQSDYSLRSIAKQLKQYFNDDKAEYVDQAIKETTCPDLYEPCSDESIYVLDTNDQYPNYMRALTDLDLWDLCLLPANDQWLYITRRRDELQLRYATISEYIEALKTQVNALYEDAVTRLSSSDINHYEFLFKNLV